MPVLSHIPIIKRLFLNTSIVKTRYHNVFLVDADDPDRERVRAVRGFREKQKGGPRMNGRRAHWMIAGMAAIAGALAALLAVECLHQSDLRAAFGQSGGPRPPARPITSLRCWATRSATPRRSS